MKTLDMQDLANVAGGASKSDTLTQTLNSVQSSIKDLSTQNNNNSGNNLMMPMMMMAMMNRQQAPTVVTTAAAPSAAPIVNVNTRVRRW